MPGAAAAQRPGAGEIVNIDGDAGPTRVRNKGPGAADAGLGESRSAVTRDRTSRATGGQEAGNAMAREASVPRRYSSRTTGSLNLLC